MRGNHDSHHELHEAERAKHAAMSPKRGARNQNMIGVSRSFECYKEQAESLTQLCG